MSEVPTGLFSSMRIDGYYPVMVAMLKRLEWSVCEHETQVFCDEVAYVPVYYCPICDCAESDGHEGGCELGELLKKVS